MDRANLELRNGRLFDLPQNAAEVYIDAGIANIRVLVTAADGGVLADALFPSNQNLHELFSQCRVTERLGRGERSPIFITGKLAPMVHKVLGCGKLFMPSAALWLAAKHLLATCRDSVQSLAMVEISASGYMLVGVDRAGELKDDLLIANPRCGAGSGVNLDRVLQKLGLKRDDVDVLLHDYLGEAGRNRRRLVSRRADRCGVFSSSATVSDKNQGIPLAVALATTLKSEVLKTLSKLPRGFDKACLTGRIFRWKFARDCAEDCLQSVGVHDVQYDTENTLVLQALREFVARVGAGNIAQPNPHLLEKQALAQYPAFSEIKAKHENALRYLRLPGEPVRPELAEGLVHRVVSIGLDVGSTMAKVVVADDQTGEALLISAYSNSGDTIETIKHVFRELRGHSCERMKVRSVGVTGSARFQVKEAITRIYPSLAARTSVLVENYAHARGSIEYARDHLARLAAHGVRDVNRNFCILVDIGGEDTKISTIALEEAELFNNAMNLKCSAGTGSLMDTLSALFGLEDAGEASRRAFEAGRSFVINATCAVFLMENAQKLQALGVPREEILASANWAIVENMARTLWSQLEMPANTVVLLHGQTMLSEPLPLAVTHRLQSYLGGAAYALVPPYPGHRACFGLIRTQCRSAPQGAEEVELSRFIEARFEKQIIQCKGAVCSDPSAVCNRASLKCTGADGKRFSFTLGGCSAINELFARKRDKTAGAVEPVRDTYKEIWDFIDRHHPRSEDARRLVIARSFCVSEWAYFLSQMFADFGIPVHVDSVKESDLSQAQPLFNVDSCAPQIGAVGQYRRLAAEPHGIILVPQIEMLPSDGKSLGRTCTINQGGVVVAQSLAAIAAPQARFHAFSMALRSLDAAAICDQTYDRLVPVFQYYGLAPTRTRLQSAIERALAAHLSLQESAANFAADLMEDALAEGHRIALVVGREYVLNPGIYDSHIRRLLRDKRMAVIPSYVLDVELNEDYKHLYWRNPHAIVTILDAVARKTLHQRVRHRRLQRLFERIEANTAGELLPVVQISTFSCGPDSVTNHLVGEIMKKRPFLLIQSDAILKELAHLENRVNTYVRQLELGLHAKLSLGGESHFEVKMLDDFENKEALDLVTDVIYLPTLDDNRTLTSVLRGAGYTCIDNYGDEHDLEALIKLGRSVAGDAVCAPLAGVYADLMLAVQDFERRKRSGDLLVAGKTRLLFFNNRGTGPCRQGRYVETHKLFAHQALGSPTPRGDGKQSNLPCGGLMQFLVASEAQGYSIGLKEWTQVRLYQAVILHAVLQDLFFAGGTVCTNQEQYEQFVRDHRELKHKLYRILEDYRGPGRTVQWLVERSGEAGILSRGLKYLAYRMHGRDLAEPLSAFAAKWLPNGLPKEKLLRICASGEVYMRVSQARDVYRILLANLGFGRFSFEVNPIWSYLEYLLEEEYDYCRERKAQARAALQRETAGALDRHHAQTAEEDHKQMKIQRLCSLLRNVLAAPLYKAARLSVPPEMKKLLESAREILPTLRPVGEFAPYLGGALHEMEHGAHLLLNIAPNSCMVSTMCEVLTPRLLQSKRSQNGRIQYLFSAEGDVNEELLTLAALKTIGPDRYFDARAI
ncbi:MAG: hypothetical protein A3G24_02535 [Betaproteobacteria bacterium RIFCSPLOWO2_12_FULL_62_13]|nr:MAG: hypothetical protein A3G24_02535 [Betaproteobacteria bacterium RIFCSPLOWO2_12_FULL_62_13]